MTVETHPLAPFLPKNAQLLMLGSFPPPKTRWKMNFYYPNLQNDMWRIFGLVFFGDKDYFLDTRAKAFKEQKIREFLMAQGIGISDTAYKVERLQNNAADKFLHIIEKINLNQLLASIPDCHTILTTGEKATATLVELLPNSTNTPKIGSPSQVFIQNRSIQLYRLPSSSRAYPLALHKKARIYWQFFKSLGFNNLTDDVFLK